MRPLSIELLIVGYGNPLRGDDALGWRAAELLAAAPGIANNPLVQIVTVHQLAPELAETIATAKTALFIDAMAPAPGIPPGTLHWEEILRQTAGPQTLGHHLTPTQLLACAEAIYQATPKAFVVSVTAHSFDYGAHLSPAVEDAIARLVPMAGQHFALSLAQAVTDKCDAL